MMLLIVKSQSIQIQLYTYEPILDGLNKTKTPKRQLTLHQTSTAVSNIEPIIPIRYCSLEF